MSPLPFTQSTYQVQPTQNDSVRSANYLSVAGSINGVGDNDDFDMALLGQIKFHHAGKAGRFQYFGGAQVNLGSYNSSDKVLITDTAMHYPQKDLYFVCSGAVTAGFSYVIPVHPNFDWRIIGLEGTIGYEGGQYVKYRKALPGDYYEYIDRQNLQQLYFLTTELVFRKKKNGSKIAYQLAVGTHFKQLPTDEYDYDGNIYNFHTTVPAVVRNTVAFVGDPISFHLQFTGSRYFAGIGAGLTYQLGRNRK
ncbi:hypothetical protein FPE01S_03_05960 [Flavihumibacter petaseus NBRC 106054]|uniref:Outer membrane protein beta-barrel domain-containing protein n=2 Tax=Flavihumibacter TaxID=1004301 RepID=A0A0E9N443_9BACT|nr:hypothetical protein FPE01S_03_05960 [Flavihumibacter petaseus NBRC 106054]